MEKSVVLEALQKYNNLEEMSTRQQFVELGGFLQYGDKVVAEESLLSAAAWCGVPKKFLTSCPMDLQTIILNKFFQGYDAPRTIFKGNSVVAFSDAKSHLLHPEMVINSLEKSFELDKFDKLFVNKGSVELYTVGKKEQTIAVGDVSAAGIYLSFSPYGEYAPEITSIVYRLACTNGMLRQDNLIRYQYRGGGDPYQWIDDTAAIAYNMADSEFDKLRAMREIKINGNTASIVRHMLQGLPKNVREMVENEVMNQKPGTLYDLLQIITYVASHNLEDSRQVFNLMGVGGELSSHVDVCETCHQIIEN